jgi:hypothetical protein
MCSNCGVQVPRPDENTNIAGPSDLGVSFPSVGRMLVDCVVSPACLLPRMHMISASPDPANTNTIEMPWVNSTHFAGTPFYTDPIIITFVEDPTRQTTKTNAQRHYKPCKLEVYN